METNLQGYNAVEFLLLDAQFSIPQSFSESLHNRLIQQINRPGIKQTGTSTYQPASNHHENNRTRQRWVLSSLVVLCLVFGVLGVTVPAVRAQVISFIQSFGVELPFVDKGIVRSTFKPVAPTRIPTEMKNFISFHQDTGGPVYTELRYFSRESFIILYEAQSQPGFVLPQGEPIRIGQINAVAESDLSGMVYLAEQAPQPWREAGSGGGGGIIDDSSDAPPSKFIYHGATKITWVQSGLLIELLTNLPYDMALETAASVQPASNLDKP